MNRIKFLGILLAASTVAGGAAKAQGLPMTEPANTVTLGIVSPTTGSAASRGMLQLNGFRLAAEHIRKSGGFTVAGKKFGVEFKIRDSGCNADGGAKAMRELTGADRVPVVLGEICDEAAGAEAAIARKRGVAIVFTGPTGDALTAGDNSWVFRINARRRQIDAALADYIGAQPWSRVAVIARNSDSGRLGVRRMKLLLPGPIGRGYVGFFNSGAEDFAGHIAKLHAADAALLLMDQEPASALIRQLRDAGLTIPLAGLPATGSVAFGRRFEGDQLDGVFQTTVFPPRANVPGIKSFGAAYRSKYQSEPNGFAAHAYDGVFAAVDAMRRAGTVSDAKAVRGALARTDMPGVTGPIRFDTTGQNAPPVFITGWCAGGKRRILAPKSAAAPCGKG